MSTSAVADYDIHRASSLRHTTSSYSHSRISGAHLDTMIVVGESKDNHNMNGRLSHQVHDQRRDSDSRSVDGIDTSILLSNTAGGLHLLHPSKSGRSSKPPPKEVVFNIDSKHQFRDFRPLTFQLLRQLSGISEEDYLTFIAQPTKERLSEGASGAFFFMCGSGELIVKTVRKHEGRTLLNILDKYLKHLSSHPESMLVRFLGLHSITMYGNEFMFVVMKNIMPPHVIINEKYDIKGSWVNRDASAAFSSKAYGTLIGGFGNIGGAGGQKKSRIHTCKHCNELFNACDLASKNSCSAVVGSHEPIITMKDNNMTSKIRLYPEHAYSVIDTLNSDSDALCDMGVTDYSLLIGVKNMQYDIDSQSTGRRRLSSSFSADAPPYSHSQPMMPMMRERERRNNSIMAHNNSNNVNFNLNTQSMPPAKGANYDLTQPTTAAGNAYPARAVIAPCEYYLGVIDILQTWSYSKDSKTASSKRFLELLSTPSSCGR
eukprot:gene25479-33251_t